MKSQTTIIAITMLCLAGTTLQVLNGCTKDKCTMCMQSAALDTVNQYNRYCTACKNSKLNIVTAGVDQKCTGSETSISNCLVEHENPLSAGQIVCQLCREYFYLSLDGKTCTDTTRSCVLSKVQMAGAGETCIACKNNKKFVVEGSNPNFYVKCEDGGTEISNCEHKSYDRTVAITAAGQNLPNKCFLCKKGYGVQPDGSCLKLDDNWNKHCQDATPIVNQCTQCNWYRGSFATGTAKGTNTDANTNKDNGNQLCFSGILGAFVTFASVFMAFFRF